jgi:hypothetical protein
VLGGSAGTTLDAFQLIHDVRKYGGRAALFGRKINQAENQLAFIEFLRHIVDGVIEPVEAVKAYHAVLAKLSLQPHRSLQDDLALGGAAASYGGQSTTASAGDSKKLPPTVDFAKMTSKERLAYHQARLNRLFG